MLCHIRRLLPDDVARTLACRVVTTHRLLQLAYVQYIQPKLIKASEGAKLFVTYSVTGSETHTHHSSAVVTILTSGCSSYYLQTQCHHIQCQENSNAIISPQSTK